MVELENKTYNIYENSFKIDDKRIMFYGNINFDEVLPKLGSASSDIYAIRIGSKLYALKVYNELQEGNLSAIQDKLSWNIDSYITPIRVMYFNGKFSGYLMNFCKGKNLGNRKLAISTEEFATSSAKLFDDSQKISLYRYILYDLYITNIMYDNGFKIIDNDNYIKAEDECSLDEIEKLNIVRLNQLLTDVFVRTANLKNMIFSNPRIKQLLDEGHNGTVLFEEIFNEICKIAYSTTDEPINEVGDIGKVFVKSKIGKKIRQTNLYY